jgi:hypothetical protein
VWQNQLLDRLVEADVGIVCLTPENVRSDWLHFEAGALAHRVAGARIFTYLHLVSAARLTGPLSHYQSTVSTESDTRQLVLDLRRAMEERGPAPAEDLVRAAFERAWQDLRARLSSAPAPGIGEFVVGFEGLFQRKTFEEPLAECSDMTWTRRLVGAVETRERLAAAREAVEQAASPHMAYQYERLISELDGYAMELRSSLIQDRREFGRLPDGRVNIPDEIQLPCEARRRKVLWLAGRVAQPGPPPVLADAVKFKRTVDANDRRAIVRELKRQLASGELSLEGADLRRAAANVEWDLDRIAASLAYAGGREPRTVEDAAEAVVQEYDVQEARTWSSTVMPLHYALKALLRTLERAPDPAAGRGPAESVVGLVRPRVESLPEERSRKLLTDLDKIAALTRAGTSR